MNQRSTCGASVAVVSFAIAGTILSGCAPTSASAAPTKHAAATQTDGSLPSTLIIGPASSKVPQGEAPVIDEANATSVREAALWESLPIQSLDWQPDSSRFAVDEGLPGSITFYDVSTYASIPLVAQIDITGISFSPTGGEIAASGYPGGIARLFDSKTGAIIKEADGSERCGAGTMIEFRPDGKSIVIGASWQEESYVDLWDLNASVCHRAIFRHPGWLIGISLSPDGSKLLATFGPGSGVAEGVLWDFDRNAIRCAFRAWGIPHFMPGGKSFAVMDPKNGLSIWESDGCSKVEDIGAVGEAFDISPNGALIAVARSDTLQLWSLRHKLLVASTAIAVDQPTYVRFSPNGRLIIVAESGGGNRPGKITLCEVPSTG